MNKLTLSIRSTRENLTEVECFIETICDEFYLPECMRGKVALATIEAANNSLLYGNKEDPEKEIKITAVRNKQKVIVMVEDEGAGFDFKKIPDPVSTAGLMAETGRGLFLMATLTDGLFFAKNGAKVIMFFNYKD